MPGKSVIVMTAKICQYMYSYLICPEITIRAVGQLAGISLNPGSAGESPQTTLVAVVPLMSSVSV